jgi:AmmeMemoRadiSam system protein A
MSQRLTREQEQFLLKLARKSIEHHFKEETPLETHVHDPLLEEKRGAFVTLKVDGKLRGCIGYPLPHKPLYEAVIEMAVAAASQDFRFKPLTPEELDRLKIEISVLSVPAPVGRREDVEVGSHGIVVSKGFNRGLLLPQVAVEYGWDRDTFLRQGCLKAGLAPDEWKKGAKIETFTAQVFSE